MNEMVIVSRLGSAMCQRMSGFGGALAAELH
jgi:hypothetical protein